MADSRLFYAEWGLEPGVDIEDVDGWYLANPALGIRISEEAVRAELDALRLADPDQFARERLGVPESPEGESPSVIDLAVWTGLADPASEIAANRTFALDVSPDRHQAAFGMAGRRADGLLHVETFDARPGTRWVLQRGCEIAAHEKTPIWVDRQGPAASFIGLFREQGVEVVEVSTLEHAQACGRFIDAATNSELRHLGQPSLDSALKGAVLRRSGDADLWARRAGRVDITPLVAVTLALGAVPRKATVEPWAVYR